MKAATLVLALLFLSLGGLFAQYGGDYDVEMVFTEEPELPVSVYFGIYVEDLDFPQAHELGYKYLYGILVTEVVDGSPADEAGLLARDIMMEIDDKPVTDQAEFDRLRSEMWPGQKINIRVWRDVEITDVELVLQPREDDRRNVRQEIRREVYYEADPAGQTHGPDYGWGGGSWVPYWFIVPVADVNELIDKIGDPLPLPKGFEANAISADGVFMNGGAGRAHFGNGILIGGVGAGYEYKASDPTTNTNLLYELSFGGATIDKRFMLGSDLGLSLGVMLGAGGHTLKYSQTQSGFTWPETFTGNNYTATVKREYFVVQPRAELILRLVDWLSLRAEVGYLYGVSTYGGWKVEATGDDFGIAGSPDTPFHGLSFSVGPWIGF